jgi:hypothetical protein
MKPIGSLLCLALATVVLASNTPPGGALITGNPEVIPR